MSYRSASRAKSPPHLVIAAARCGVRNALRPFLRRCDLAFIAVLVVPEATADYYRRAVSSLIQDPMPVDECFNETASVFAVVEPAIDPRSIYDRIKHARQVVVVTENLEHLQADFRAGADLIADVVRPTPEHFVAAAREVRLPGMTREHAEFLSTLSFDAILVGVRPTRPLMSSLRHMKRVAAARSVEPEQPPKKPPEVGLENMHGYGRAKDWGLQLADDLRAWRTGEITWDDVDRGALLYGPPGCGKTSYAKALAATCGVDLVTASAAKWQARGHLGDYLKAMRAAFDEARKKAPSILFIDEFDSFGDREAAGDDEHRDYRRQVINGLLECLDPSEGREGVVVVGATNSPHVIDRALLRSGRLETLVEIPLPDADARVAILHHHLRDHGIEGDFQRFVAATRGWSGADIEKLARDTRRIARRRKVPVDEGLLLQALPERYVMTAEELRHAAVHEAGHAIVGVLLSRDPLISVHVEREVPIHGAVQVAGHAMFEPARGIIKSGTYYDGRIAMLLGGIAAETIVYGYHADGAGGVPSSDLAVASDVATRAERHYGLGATLAVDLGKGSRPLEYLRDRDPELRRLVEARLKAQFGRAVDILNDRRAEFDSLVDLLVIRGRATGDEVRALLSQQPRDTASVRT